MGAVLECLVFLLKNLLQDLTKWELSRHIGAILRLRSCLSKSVAPVFERLNSVCLGRGLGYKLKTACRP